MFEFESSVVLLHRDWRNRMNMKLLGRVLLVVMLLACAAIAADQEKPGSGWAVDVKVGSLGIGADVSRSIIPRVLNFRTGASFFNYSADFDEKGITYGADLKLGAVPIAIDVFPFKNWLRLGGGVIINLNEVKGTGKAKEGTTDTIDIGDGSYSLSALGQVNGKVKFNRVAPYFGLGFNNPIKTNGHLGFFVDLGMMYHGSPTAAITTTNSFPGLQENINKQLQDTNKDLKDFKFFPVIQMGLSYKF
jgi:hypothetical protein